MWREHTDTSAAIPHPPLVARGTMRLPKVREYAEVKLEDGQVLTGYVFIGATIRIQGLMNGAAHFSPFVDDRDEVHLINKAAVTRVRPFD
jgi:hypothetical protein